MTNLSNSYLKKLNRLSVFISKVLRHNPELLSLDMSPEGWVSTSSLIDGINLRGKNPISLEELKLIEKLDEKGRYSFNDDFSLIRCEQGHSTPLVKDMNLEIKEPPTVLYHGTSVENAGRIFETGLLSSMERLYVHFASDKETALQVGARHGEPCLLTVDTKGAITDGHDFYLSKNGVWLSKDLPSKYLNATTEVELNSIKCALISDLHLEESALMQNKKSQRVFIHDCLTLPDIPSDIDVLLLAGDICELKKQDLYKMVLDFYCPKVKHVIAVPGNHEYWGKSYQKGEFWREELRVSYPNLHFINNEVIEVEGIKIFGSTMWNNFNHDHFVISEVGRQYPTISNLPLDAKRIKWKTVRGYRKGKGSDIYSLNKRSVKLASEFISSLGDDEVGLVLSHFPLTPEMCLPSEIGSDCAGVSYSVLEGKKGLVFAHGHLHGCTQSKYNTYTGQTAYVNPRGNFHTPEAAREYKPLIFTINR